MLTSISPLGERARGNRWWLTVAWLAAGAILSAAAVGGVLGALGQALAGDLNHGARLGVLAVAGAVAGAWDWSGRRLPGRRQVNEDWLVAYRSWFYGAGFGIQLGAAVVTVVNTALVPLFMLAAFMAADTTAGLWIGAAFGAARSATMALSGRVRTPQDLNELHRRLDVHADRARLLGAAIAAALGGAAVVGLLAP